MCTAEAFSNAGQIGATVYQQSVNQRAQERYQEQVYLANKRNADDAAIVNYGLLAERTQQESEQAADALSQSARAAIEARGTASAAAGEAGVEGRSVQTILNDFAVRESEFRFAIQTNLENRRQQSIFEGEAIRSGQANQILSALPRPVAGPNYLSAAFALFGTAAGGYAQNVQRIRSGAGPNEAFFG